MKTTLLSIVLLLSGCTMQTSGGFVQLSGNVKLGLPSTNSQAHKEGSVHVSARNDYLRERYPNAFAAMEN